MSQRALVAFVVALAGCTVAPIDLAGKQCPCTTGYVCDESVNRCVPLGTDLAVPVVVEPLGLESLVPSVGTLSPAFDTPTTGYSIIVPMSATSISFTAVAKSMTAHVTVNGALLSSTTSSPIDLHGVVAKDVPIDVTVGEALTHYLVHLERVGDFALPTMTDQCTFGAAIALSDDTVVVGEPCILAVSKVHVFSHDGYSFSEVSTIDGTTKDGFGRGLAMQGVGEGADLFVGAIDDSTVQMEAGAVHHLVKHGGAWMETEVIRPTTSIASGAFGELIAVDGDRLVVGAPAYNNDGTAYVFERGGAGQPFVQVAQLTPLNPAGQGFGDAVAISGDRIAVGAPFNSSGGSGIGSPETPTNGSLSGAVFVYVRQSGTWSQEAFIKASNASSAGVYHYSLFGSSVALEGDELVAGAPGEDSAAMGIDGDETSSHAAYQRGAVYAFSRSSGAWVQEAYIKPSETALGQFGWSIAYHAGLLAVGAPYDNYDGIGIWPLGTTLSTSRDGASYVFTRSMVGDWSQVAYVKPPTSSALGSGTTLALSPWVLLAVAPEQPSGGSMPVVPGAVYAYPIDPSLVP